MPQMRDIGKRLTAEQNLRSEDITWLVVIGQAILRAFVRGEGRPMRELAEILGISPTTFYSVLRLAVGALMLVRSCKVSVQALLDQVNKLQNQLKTVKQAYEKSQAKIQILSKDLARVLDKITLLQTEISRLKSQWTLMKDRMILVLKMSGRCTVRSIVEVMEYGWGEHVSIGYVQQIISQAGTNARSAFHRLLKVITLSGAISIDEVFLKELGQKVLGVVIVDPLSGLILRLQRCSERSKDAVGGVIKAFAESGFKDQIKLCLTDMYAGYLEPVKTYIPKAVHQFCWFHINCFHIGATILQAKRVYERAVKVSEVFDKKHSGPLTEAEQEQRQEIITNVGEAQRFWQGAKRFQSLLKRLLWSPTLHTAAARLEQLIRVAAIVQNPYVQKMALFLDKHRKGLLVFYACLESSQHVLKRLSKSKQQWIRLTKRWAVPITSNSAEHVFRCFRRFTKSMDHFGTKPATERFFDLFAFYHNVRILRAGKLAGNSLLASSHVDVEKLFGTSDPYTMLGLPPSHEKVMVS